MGRLSRIEHQYVARYTLQPFRCLIDTPTWGFGFIREEWGVRIIVGRWDYCWRKEGSW